MVNIFLRSGFCGQDIGPMQSLLKIVKEGNVAEHIAQGASRFVFEQDQPEL